MSRRGFALAAATLLAAGCARTQRVSAPAAPGKAQAPAPAPDARGSGGVPPRGDRPAVPASPQSLLAEGAVARIQEALGDRGYLGQHRAGTLDAATSAAIRKFQGAQGLAETGFPDRETLAKLGIDPETAYSPQ